MALANYAELPSDQRFEYVVRAVLTARGMDPAQWRDYATVVEDTIAGGGRSRGSKTLTPAPGKPVELLLGYHPLGYFGTHMKHTRSTHLLDVPATELSKNPLWLRRGGSA